MGSKSREEVTCVSLAVVPAQRRVIEWDDEGNPVVKLQPLISKQDIKSVYFVVAAQPFEIDLRPDEVKFQGMTVVEALIRKQMECAIRSGDVAAMEIIMDRLIDRPMSMNRNENFNVALSYEDELRKIKERSESPATVIDAEDVSVFGDLA